jgi:hypothetical protein
MSGLQRVLDAVAESGGTTTVEGLAERTGLDADLVRVALHQLVALGRLGRDGMSLACPEDGCGGCASSASTCGTAGRGSLVTLTLRPPAARG